MSLLYFINTVLHRLSTIFVDNPIPEYKTCYIPVACRIYLKLSFSFAASHN